ncbi:MAG: mechanosensitive ion channel family protein [Myxococcota bacterium]
MEMRDAFQTVVDKLWGWAEGFIGMLPNLAVAIVVMILFGLVARGVQNLVEKGMARLSKSPEVSRLFAKGAQISVLVAGLFIVLGILQLEKTVTSLLAGVGIVGLALGFAFQDIAANFASGVLMAFRRPFVEGDLIETNDFFGTVKRVDLRNTLIRRPEGQDVIIPNKDVFQNAIINYSADPDRRVDLKCGCHYDDDLEAVRDVAVRSLEPVAEALGKGAVEFFFEEFGDSSIHFVVRFWILRPQQNHYMHAMSEAVIALKKGFDEAGITIPFPIRTLDFDVPHNTEAFDIFERTRGGKAADGTHPRA